MVHFADWYPTLLAAAGVNRPAEATLSLDGVNVLSALRGAEGQVCTKRFWQWNRYEPFGNCNAAVRDGDWKLVRPMLEGAMEVPDIHWMYVSVYCPTYFTRNGVVEEDDPERNSPDPPPAELYNLADDPGETRNLADEHRDIAHRLQCDLETWFEQVMVDYRSTDDVW